VLGLEVKFLEHPAITLQRCHQISGLANLWLNYEAADSQKSGAGLHSIKQANDAKPGRQRVQFGHCSTMRIGENIYCSNYVSKAYYGRVATFSTFPDTPNSISVFQQQTSKQRNVSRQNQFLG
jgi:hypothetical protein